MKFKVGQLISARGTGNNKELFEVVYMDSKYIQAINIKQNGYVSLLRVIATDTYREASDADIQSFIARYLKYNLIQNYSEGGQYDVKSYIDRL